MLGYKGIRYVNGILRAKVSFGNSGEIFEVGVPKQKFKVDENEGFTENGYSFCEKIEDVLFWEDYCKPLDIRRKGVDSRLFLIDTLDSKVIGTPTHFKAEQIVVLREITHNEIVEYFTKYPELKKHIKNDTWKQFCNDKIEEYKQIVDEAEINKTIVKNCIRLGQLGLCKQDSINLLLSKCKNCIGKAWPGDAFCNLTDYYYLVARMKLYNGINLEEINEYNKLNNCTIERNNLLWLSQWLNNRKTQNNNI